MRFVRLHDGGDELDALLHANQRLDVVVGRQIAEQCDAVDEQLGHILRVGERNEGGCGAWMECVVEEEKAHTPRTKEVIKL